MPTNSERHRGPSGPRARLRTLIEESDQDTRENHIVRSAAASSTAQDAARHWLPGILAKSTLDPGRLGLLGLVLVGLMALIVLAFGILADRPTAQPVPRLPPPMPSTVNAPKSIVVSVVGRVTRPGLVTIEHGQRVADAVHAAGGPLPDTDLTGLNLARKLADGEQLYVGIPPPAGVNPDVAAANHAPGDGRVNLNTATVEQLDELPGVGEVTAERIVGWREEHGGFASVEQLREVDGIGDARMERLRDHIRT